MWFPWSRPAVKKEFHPDDLIPVYYGEYFAFDRVLELILAAWCIHCSVPIVTYSFTVLPTSITSIIRLLPSTFSPFIRDKINTFTSIQSTWMPSLDVSAIASPSTFNESNTSATVQSRTESLSTLHRLYEVGQNSINVGVALFVLGFAVMCLAAYFVELARAMRTDMQWAILEASAKRSSDAKALTDALLQPALQVASPREATTLFFADSESDDAETYVGSEPSTPSSSVSPSKWILPPLFLSEEPAHTSIQHFLQRRLPCHESDEYEEDDDTSDDSVSTASPATVSSGFNNNLLGAEIRKPKTFESSDETGFFFSTRNGHSREIFG